MTGCPPKSLRPTATSPVRSTTQLKTAHMIFITSILLFVSCLMTIPGVQCSQASIKLTDNEYRGIYIGFSSDIPEDSRQRESLVSELQALIQGASNLMYKALDQRAYFKEVTFLIPKSWDTSQWSQSKLVLNAPVNMMKTRTLKLSDADFVVKSQGEAFSDNPHTIQYGACGEPGLQIQLSQRFLTDGAAGASNVQRAKAILRQWTHYRYGVFAEHGYHNDPLYPLFRSPPGSQASGDERITSCAATSNGLAALHAVNKTRQGAVCSLGTDQSGSPRDAVCIPHVDEEKNTDIVSSLMSHALNNVEYFCDSKTHDVDAPNKQNALCNEMSIWEVIFRHSDFANGRNLALRRGTDQIRTEFKFLQEADTRVGLIVDTEQPLFIDILDRFIKKLEPDSQVLILDRPEERENANWKTAKQWESDGARIWARQGPLRLKSMIDFFLSKLDMVPVDEAGSSELIIVTAGSIEDNENDVNTIVANIREKNVALRVVIYPYSGEAKTNITMLNKLVSQAKGTLQLVARDDAQQASTSSQLALDNALDALPDDGHKYQHVLIAREMFTNGEQTVRFSFKVDESLLRDDVRLIARFVPTSTRDLTSPHYELISPHRSFSTKSSEYKRKLGSGGFEVPLNEPNMRHGEWKLQLARHDNDETLVGLAYAVVPQKVKPIKARCWVSTNRAVYQPKTAAGAQHPPLTLFVSLAEDYNKLVQRAVVEVTLTDDRGQPLNNTPPLTMSDDGLGRPDITSGDGIYSQLLLDVAQPGYYGARVSVHGIDGQTKIHRGLRSSDGSSAVTRYNNPLTACCGSSVPESVARTDYVYNLQRELDCGFFHFDGHFDKSNYLAPINDLRVRSVDTDRRTVTIAWTEPGNVAHYEYKLFRSYERRQIRENFANVGRVVDQLTFSGIQPDVHATINVTLPEAGTYYLAIKLSAIGDNRLASVSNVINFIMSADPSVTTTEDSDELSHFSTDHSRSGIAGLQTWHIVAIAAASLIVLVLFIACLICVCASRKRKSDKDSESAHFGSNSKHGLETGMSNLTIQTTMGASNSNLVSEKVGTLTGGIGNISSTISEHNLHRAASVNGGALVAHNNVHHSNEMNVQHMSPIQS